MALKMILFALSPEQAKWLELEMLRRAAEDGPQADTARKIADRIKAGRERWR